MLNFTYTLTKPADGEYGIKKQDGISFTGMVGELADGIIDIGTPYEVDGKKCSYTTSQSRSSSFFSAVTDFTVSHERSAVITFAEPITKVYNSFFIKNPSESYNFTAYLDPLHYMSWLVVLLVILVTPPLLFASAR